MKANVIVYNYSYLLDPKISNLVSKDLPEDCIVVFDECHNMDNACIDSLSLFIDRKMVELATNNISQLDDMIKRSK
jgi:DNA excision repair protein ERCC-2